MCDGAVPLRRRWGSVSPMGLHGCGIAWSVGARWLRCRPQSWGRSEIAPTPGNRSPRPAPRAAPCPRPNAPRCRSACGMRCGPRQTGWRWGKRRGAPGPRPIGARPSHGPWALSRRMRIVCGMCPGRGVNSLSLLVRSRVRYGGWSICAARRLGHFGQQPPSVASCICGPPARRDGGTRS